MESRRVNDVDAAATLLSFGASFGKPNTGGTSEPPSNEAPATSTETKDNQGLLKKRPVVRDLPFASSTSHHYASAVSDSASAPSSAPVTKPIPLDPLGPSEYDSLHVPAHTFMPATFRDVRPVAAPSSAIANPVNADSRLRSEAHTHSFHKFFPEALMEMLSDESNAAALSWMPHGRSFIIRDPYKFTDEVLPKYFNCKFSSFTRKLYRWGFRQISRGPDQDSYYHRLFRRDMKNLCHRMICKEEIRDGCPELHEGINAHSLMRMEQADRLQELIRQKKAAATGAVIQNPKNATKTPKKKGHKKQKKLDQIPATSSVRAAVATAAAAQERLSEDLFISKAAAFKGLVPPKMNRSIPELQSQDSVHLVERHLLQIKKRRAELQNLLRVEMQKRESKRRYAELLARQGRAHDYEMMQQQQAEQVSLVQADKIMECSPSVARNVSKHVPLRLSNPSSSSGAVASVSKYPPAKKSILKKTTPPAGPWKPYLLAPAAHSEHKQVMAQAMAAFKASIKQQGIAANTGDNVVASRVLNRALDELRKEGY